MPPHLHPRSTATSTLFASTLLASFVIVSIPHLFPCPRPRTGQYESDKIVRKPNQDDSATGQDSTAAMDPSKVGNRQRSSEARRGVEAEEALLFRELEQEARLLEKEAAAARECPVPKPKGFLGRVLGFDTAKVEEQGAKNLGK